MSSQACISINPCTELSKTKFSLYCYTNLNTLQSLKEGLLRGSDPPAPLTLAALPFPLIMFPTGSYDIHPEHNKWRLSNLFSGENNVWYPSVTTSATFYKTQLKFTMIFFLQRKISMCHAFNMLIEDQSFILIFS